MKSININPSRLLIRCIISWILMKLGLFVSLARTWKFGEKVLLVLSRTSLFSLKKECNFNLGKKERKVWDNESKVRYK